MSWTKMLKPKEIVSGRLVMCETRQRCYYRYVIFPGEVCDYSLTGIIKGEFTHTNWKAAMSEGKMAATKMLNSEQNAEVSDTTDDDQGTEAGKQNTIYSNQSAPTREGGLQGDWISAEIKPPYNKGVLVFIPEEDYHITSGMWDIDNKWVLLDEYRVPECEVTHWMKIPEVPEQFKKEIAENHKVMKGLSQLLKEGKISLPTPPESKKEGGDGEQGLSGETKVGANFIENTTE
jgi:hypothetical protein